MWEFPGGKLESGEQVRAGLARELAEELGIRVDSARPLIRVRHDYPDRGVLPDVWRVTAWHGSVRGREGQSIRWLSADALAGLPMPAAAWLGVSCHDARELTQAARIGADFAVLSPVAATPAHAQAVPLGWKRFEALVEEVNLPVFALGGMGREQLETAWHHGGQGIAAMRGLWKGSAAGQRRPCG